MFVMIQNRIDYLLTIGFREEQSPLLGRVFISKSNQVRFTISDITYRWESLRIFD